MTARPVSVRPSKAPVSVGCEHRWAQAAGALLLLPSLLGAQIIRQDSTRVTVGDSGAWTISCRNPFRYRLRVDSAGRVLDTGWQRCLPVSTPVPPAPLTISLAAPSGTTVAGSSTCPGTTVKLVATTAGAVQAASFLIDGATTEYPMIMAAADRWEAAYFACDPWTPAGAHSLVARARSPDGTLQNSAPLVVTVLYGAPPPPPPVDTTPVPPPPPPPPPPTAGGDTVLLTIQRTGAGSGDVLVSSGIPLQPGKLLPTATKNVRVIVGGQEKAAYAEALASRHPDGTVRSVLVQFRHTLAAATPVQGLLILGSPRSADISKTAVGRGMPAAVALPTSPDYLVSTQLVGSTVTVAQSPSAAYESNFVTYGDQAFARDGGNWEQGGYYERGLAWFAWWVRTGKYEYWRRGMIDALAYLNNDIAQWEYYVQPYWTFWEQVALIYLLTGDESIRTSLGRGADKYVSIWTPANIGDPNYGGFMDSRSQARMLLVVLHGQRYSLPSPAGNNWTALSRTYLNVILNTQSPDGAWRTAGNYGEQFNFQTGMLLDAFVKYWEWFEQDPRIPPAVQRSLDFLWNTQWLSSALTFRYATNNPGNDPPGPEPSYDPSMLICHNFSWYYSLAPSTRATYKTRGDACFNGGVPNGYLTSSKQFNQNYQMSFRHLGYRK
jgi:hypothetical protein